MNMIGTMHVHMHALVASCACIWLDLTAGRVCRVHLGEVPSSKITN